MTKAVREARMHTSWRDPQPAYENALCEFIRAALADREFMADFGNFLRPILQPARISSLSQTLIKLTAPGVPDLYQGTELWDLSLVDPDNRRPVDYAVRRSMLSELNQASLEQVWAGMDEGLPKLFVIERALHVRQRLRDLFGPDGAYEPLDVVGEKCGHAVAFARGGGVITVVPRLLAGLAGRWGDTVVRLPDGLWQNEFTGDACIGGEVRLAELLGRFPVALLARGGRKS